VVLLSVLWFCLVSGLGFGLLGFQGSVRTQQVGFLLVNAGNLMLLSAVVCVWFQEWRFQEWCFGVLGDCAEPTVHQL
jgi:hypothetical protein